MKEPVPPGADAVHTLLHIAALKVDDLGVLTAQLDGHVRLGRRVLQGSGHGDHLLHEGNLQVFGQRQAAGTGDHGTDQDLAQLVVGLFQKVGQGLPDVGEMPLIVGEQQPVLLV